MNIKPKTIFTGDNLQIMRGMNTQSVDLIYLDPPFNSKANYAAPIGSQAAGAEFKDTWTLNDVDITWLDLIETKHPALNRVIHAAIVDSDKAYLIYMAVRLLEMKRVLTHTGSIYLHCDPTMSHYLKIMMDAVFGRQNFRNEIVWHYKKFPNKARYFQQNHDTILMYSATKDYNFNKLYHKALTENQKQIQQRGYNTKSSGGKKIVSIYDRSNPKVIAKLPMWQQEGRKIYDVQQPEQPPGPAIDDIWNMSIVGPRSAEKTGYPTQKPLKLLERIIKASSNTGDVVFDPFCGCATTCVAADRLQRNWIGIDISPKAAELVVRRIKNEQGLFQKIIHRTDIPKRTDLGKLPRYNRPENRTALYGKQKGYCSGCKEHFQEQHLEIDHIIAKSVGGTDHTSNLQLLCGHCNRVKGNRGQEYLVTKLKSE